MISYSSLTLDEFIRLNPDAIQGPVLKLVDEALEKIESLEALVEINDRDHEIKDEQIYFAQELIDSIERWSFGLSKKKQAELKILLENSSFERRSSLKQKMKPNCLK